MILYVASSRIVPGTLCSGSVECKSLIPSNTDKVQVVDVKSLKQPLPHWLNGTPILVHDSTIYKGKHAVNELKRMFRGGGSQISTKKKTVSWDEEEEEEEEGRHIHSETHSKSKPIREEISDSLFEGSMLDKEAKMNTTDPFDSDNEMLGSITDPSTISEGKITEAELKAYQKMRDVVTLKQES